MKKQLRYLLVAGLLLLAGLEGYGQVTCSERYIRVYASNQSNGANTGGVVVSGAIADTAFAVDENTLTASTLNCSGALLGLSQENKWQHFIFSQPISRNKSIHVKFTTEIAANLLGTTTIILHTYNNSTLLTSTTISSGVLGLASGTNMLDYVIPAPGGSGTYNAVRLELHVSALISASAKVKIYGAYYNASPDTTNIDIACNGIADVLHGVAGAALLGGINDVQNPLFAADGSDTTATRLVANVSVANSVFTTALFNSLSQPGDSVRVLLQKGGGGLLDVDLIADNFKVIAYKDNIPVASLATESQFLELRLLPGSSQIQVLTFKVPSQFDRIEVSLGNGLATALGDLSVYEIGRVAPKPLIQSPNLINDSLIICEDESFTLSVDPASCSGDIYHWYDENGVEITDNVNTGGTSFTPSNLAIGTHEFYVSLTRNGCSDEASERAKVTVVVNEKLDPPIITLTALE